MTPQKANTEKKMSQLNRNNIATPNYWILVSADHVTLANQKNGEECKQVISISKKAFDKFIKFYTKHQQ